MKAPRYHWLAAAVVLLAFLLRVHRFAELPPGLFFDEAFNALDGLAVFRDGYHPVFFEGNNGREPLFIYLQSVFIWLAGTTPFVIRYSAIIIGTLTVALTYPLALRLLRGEAENRRQMIALLSTFLLATLQWHLNFSRIGFRAIAQPFFEAIVIYLLYRAVQSERRGRAFYALSGLALGAGAYTYLSARLIPIGIAALIIAGVIWGQRLTKRYAGGVSLAALAAVAAVAPLAYFYFQNPAAFIGHSKDVSLLNFGGWRAMVENEVRLLGMFNWAGDVNWRHNLPGRPVFDPVIGLFFIAGVAVMARRLLKALRAREGLSGYLAPLVMVPVMLLPSLLSEGAPHYLRGIGVLPFLVLLPAVGIEAIWRLRERFRPRMPTRAAGALLLAILAFNTGSTYKAYFGGWAGSDQPYYHFDGVFIDAAEYIKRVDAGIRVYVTPWIADHATARLLLRDRPFKSFDSKRTLVLTDHKAVYAFHENGVDLDTAAAFSSRMPVPLAVDRMRDRFGKAAFDFFRIGDSATGKSQLDMVSAIGQVRAASDGAVLQFGDQLVLNGLIAGSSVTDGKIEASAGAPLPIALLWQASRRVQDNYTLSLRLIDGQGRRRLQSDDFLGGRSFPTSSWDEDELILDNPGIAVPADLPPGDYAVELAVYSLGRKTGLEVKAAGRAPGELAKLATIHVAAPSADAAAALRPPHALGTAIGSELTLLGYGLDRDTIKAGETVDVELFWRAERAVGRDVDLKLELVDKNGMTVAARQGPPLDGSYASSRWRAGDGFRDAHRLAVAARAGAGGTTIRLAVVDRASGQTLGKADLAGPTIADRPHVFEAPKPQLALQARFGDKVELLGLSSEAAGGATGLSAKAGGTIPVTLIWRGAAEMQVSYTVFVQLLNAGGQLIAQHDGLPQEGGALTSSWLPGEVIADRHVVLLAPHLPPGQYTLIAGLYNALDGKRLAVGDGDFVKLAAVTVGGSPSP